MNTTAAELQTDADPWKYFWYLVYVVVMVVTGIPLFVELPIPETWNYTGWLVIHEFSGFLFVGHTLFSNIWAMLIRLKLGPGSRCLGARVSAQARTQHHVSDLDHQPAGRAFCDRLLGRVARPECGVGMGCLFCDVADGRRQHRAGYHSLRAQSKCR